MSTNQKRPVEVVVISDLHLGTYGSRAEQLLDYLRSIKPKTLILNGDIIDIWRFSKSFWRQSHMEVIKEFINFMLNGTQVHYLIGNHDEHLRRLPEINLSNFHLANKLVLELDNNEKAWVFHGDVFDVTMKHAKWIAKLGAVGYDALIVLNCMVNYVCEKMGWGRMSFSKRIKNSVKKAVQYVNDFEQVAADLAIDKKYDYFVCGHIHQPNIKKISNSKGSVMYLNSGDWIENLTALEYQEGAWKLFYYDEWQKTEASKPAGASKQKAEPVAEMAFSVI